MPTSLSGLHHMDSRQISQPLLLQVHGHRLERMHMLLGTTRELQVALKAKMLHIQGRETNNI